MWLPRFLRGCPDPGVRPGADEIASVTFTTTVSVGNLSETKASSANVGQVLTSNIKIAGGFTTGSNGTGYILEKVAAKFDAKVGSPTGFTAAIHAASSGSPAASATCALSGSAPGTSGGQHYYKWGVTDSNDQTNTPSDAGWTIAGSAKSKVGSSDWGNISSAQASMFKVTAAAFTTSLPAPSNLSLSTVNTFKVGSATSAWAEYISP